MVVAGVGHVDAVRAARLLLLLVAATVATSAAAHPLGNYSVNHYFVLDLRGGAVELFYLVDLAEVPSFSELDRLDPDRDSFVSPEESEAYLDAVEVEVRQAVVLRLQGAEVALDVADRRLALAEGAAAMVVINVLFRFEGDVPWSDDSVSRLEVRSEYRQDTPGVRECWLVTGDRFADRTDQLTRDDRGYQMLVRQAGGHPVYQDFESQFVFLVGPDTGRQGGSAEPLSFDWTATARAATDAGDRLMASAFAAIYRDLSRSRSQDGFRLPATAVETMPGAPAGAQAGRIERRRDNGRDRLATGLTDRISAAVRSHELTVGTMILALGVAFLLGAAHARTPGHGKTLMAAYLVGERGTVRHAVLLGLIVTITHTWSILLLGLVTLSLRETISEEQLSFWFGIGSAVLIVGIGVLLFLRRYRSWVLIRHGIDPGHDHHHHHHDHEHHDHSHHHEDDAHDGPGWWSLLGLGVSGGIVPCPTALIVLLLAIRFGRLAFGILLILAFSLGLAAVLVTIGVLVVRARGYIKRWTGEGRSLYLLSVLSSAGIVVLGMWVLVWTLLQYGVIAVLPGS